MRLRTAIYLSVVVVAAIVCGLPGMAVEAQTPTPTPTPVGSISGTVTDLSLQPIQGATVRACSDWGQTSCTSTATEPDGTYLISGLEPDTYTVDVSAAGYMSEYYDDGEDKWDADWVQVLEGQIASGMDFELDTAGWITGRITDAEGEGIGGATVETGTTSLLNPTRTTTTDPDGYYALLGLPADDYGVCVTATGYAFECYDGVHDPHDATLIPVVDGQEASGINISLDVEGTISGLVTKASDGQPIEGASIRAIPQGDGWYGFADSAADGTYTIHGLAADSYRVWVVADGYVAEYFDDVLDSGMAAAVAVTSDEDTPHVDFELDAAGTISGAVTDSDGDPLKDVEVEACHDAIDFCESGYSGDDGLYEITGLAAGNYVVRTYSDDYADEYYNHEPSWDDADRVRVVEEEETPNIDFVLGMGGTISGTVLNTGGTPIGGADVTACPDDGDCVDAESDADGTYTITGLDYRGYIVEADADGGYVREYWQDVRREDDATPVVISEGNLNPIGIDFHLDIGGTISGTVTAGGNAVAGATMMAYDVADPWDSSHFSQTEDDGSYAITGIGAGSYVVAAQEYGYTTEYYNEGRWEEDATPVAVIDGQETGSINFTLEVGGSICGTVRDKDGNPIPGAGVYANPQDHEQPWWWGLAQYFGWLWGTTGSDGTYVVGDLGTGSYVVRASVDGYDDKYYNAVAERANADPVPVTEGYSSCSIDFVFGSDEPVPEPTPTPTTAPTENRCEDLKITKTADVGEVGEGGRITYTLTIKNKGDNDCEDPEVKDEIPTDTDCADASVLDDEDEVFDDPDGCDANGTVVWTGDGDMDPGDTVTLEMVVKLTSGTDEGDRIDNEACVYSEDEQEDCDSERTDVGREDAPTPSPTATPVSIQPTSMPLLPVALSPVPPQGYGGALPALAAPATGGGPANRDSAWAPSIWLLVTAGSAGVSVAGYLRLAKRRRF